MAEEKAIPKVTKITTQKRQGRYNVFLDGHYAFPISEDVMIKFRIFKGMEVDAQLQAEILAADDVSKAYNRALNYLSGHLRTEQEIEQKLRENEIPEATIKTTLKKLRALHLVDDLQYAQSYVRTIARTSDKGPIVIRRNLRAKGVLENDIETALTEYPSAAQVENGGDIAQKLSQRYRREPVTKMKQKVRQGLMTKGFSGEIVDQILAKMQFEPDPELEAQKLATEFEKVWRRNRRYPFAQRKLRTKRTLFTKGFSIDAINRLIEQQENSD
ncbi:recombination regulator RecX [Pediococcus siamensis]|uniref:recombination regulator RecX n=1 Tax=Pediococcus siamensis TaxID=381829 RepID=UPI0039A21584